MMNLYWYTLSFAHSQEYIYGNKMSAVLLTSCQVASKYLLASFQIGAK